MKNSVDETSTFSRFSKRYYLKKKHVEICDLKSDTRSPSNLIQIHFQIHDNRKTISHDCITEKIHKSQFKYFFFFNDNTLVKIRQILSYCSQTRWRRQGRASGFRSSTETRRWHSARRSYSVLTCSCTVTRSRRCFPEPTSISASSYGSASQRSLGTWPACPLGEATSWPP